MADYPVPSNGQRFWPGLGGPVQVVQAPDGKSWEPVFGAVLPSPGEINVVGPNAGITLVPGASWSKDITGMLGHRNVALFTDFSGLSSSEKINGDLQYKATSMQNPQTAWIAGVTSMQSYNLNTLSVNNTAMVTDVVQVHLAADSANTTNVTINQVVLGVA